MNKPSSIKDSIFSFIVGGSKPVSRRDICGEFNMSDASAARYISDLVDDGVIQRVGDGRSTAYVGDAADSYLATRGDIKEIEYDFDRIRQYTQKSSFFTRAQMGDLERFGALPANVTHDDYLTSVHKRLLIEASWASSVLEGNTYSLIDTQELFERGIEMPGAKQEETQMLLNHKHAIEYILENIKDINISRMDIINIQALLSEGLMKDPADVGRVRMKAVGIGQSAYRPIDVPTILSEEFDVLISEANGIKNVFDQSFFLLLNIAYLQPFADVNKRTSRMVSNIPLLKAGMMPMSFYQMSRPGYEKGMLHYYEAGDSRRLAKEYMSCYEVSSNRFMELIENKPAPSELRLRMKYRKAISNGVFEIVKEGKSIDDVMPAGLPEDEAKFFADYVGKITDSLGGGNALLYGLTEEDVNTWRGTLIPHP